MAQADPHYTVATAVWEAYYGPNAFCRQGKPRGYGGPAPPLVPVPRRQPLAKPAGRVDPRLAAMKRQIQRIEADILESERRFERRRLWDEFRFAADGTRLLMDRNGRRVLLRGQAVPFRSVSEKIDGYHEKFTRDALSWPQGCALVIGHGGPEIANTANETLRIWEEKDGLKFSAVLAETPAGRAAVNSARRATGVSINFQATERACNGVVIEVRKARLNHIAILELPAKPAYPYSLVCVHQEPPPGVTP